MKVLLALTPIIFVLIGIVVLKKPAQNVSILAAIYSVILALTVFNGNITMAGMEAYAGVISALQIMAIIFGAFTLLNVMQSSGAMDRINVTIAGVTNDKRILIILIAFCFGAFLEGAAGAGTPAAIVAPFLVGLGFQPIVAIMAALLSNGIPASFGGAGVTTISGSAGVNEIVSVMNASKATGWIHPFGALIMPTLLMILLYGKGSRKGIKGILISTGAVYGLTYFLVSNFIGPELVSMITGIVSMLWVIFYLKILKVETPEEYLYIPEGASETNGDEVDEDAVAAIKSKYTAFRALSPYVILLIALPVIRFSVPLTILTRYGYPTWVGTVIFIVAMVATLVLGTSKDIPKIVKNAFVSVIPAFLAMASLLIVANMMTSTGMMLLIAKALCNTGVFYPFIVVFIGSLGAFMTGTALGSNIMFAPLHMEAASILSVSPTLLFAANNAGSSLGNIICPNNVVAVCTTVGMLGEEGEVIKRVLLGWAILAILYGALAMMYVHVLFPTFGM